MGKFDGILICTDLDGTLLKNDKTISAENREAIEYFKREGGYFTFVTGRMPYTSRLLYEMVNPNAPVGCINGGGIYDFERGEYLWSLTLSDCAAELVEAVMDAVPSCGVLLNGLEKLYCCRENEITEMRCRITGVSADLAEYRSIPSPMGKVVFCEDGEENVLRIAEMLQSHPRADEFDFIRSERMLYEILPKGSSKGNLLPHLAAILGVDMSKTIAVGDYYNDVSMIRSAGVGVAVANAVDEAKAVADIVTVSNEEHAIAKIIEMIDRGELRL